MRLRNLVSASDLALVQNPKSFLANCLVSDAVGDWVYVSGPPVGGCYTVTKASIFDSGKLPAVGVVISKPSTTQCHVQWIGEVVAIYSGLEIGRTYLLGDDSRPTRFVSATTPSYTQRLGVAVSSTVLLVVPDFFLVKRVA